MEETTTVSTVEAPDAGAVTPESPSSAVESTPEATSAETVTPESQPAAAEGAENGTGETTSQEPESGLEGKNYKKTLEERVQELAEKRISEAEAKLTAKLEAVTQAKAEEKPNFYEIDFDKVNDHISNTLDLIEELKLEGKMLEALEMQDGLTALRQELKANEQRKAEFHQRQQERYRLEQQNSQINNQIAEASKLVAKEHNIPEEVWKKAEEWFIAERQSKPLIDAQYREKVFLQGPIAALLWAKGYIEQNMGKKEQQIIEQKEAAKTTLPPGKTSTGDPVANNRLAELRKRAESGNPSDLALYMAEKNAVANQ